MPRISVADVVGKLEVWKARYRDSHPPYGAASIP
jgi:hypothetical protein